MAANTVTVHITFSGTPYTVILDRNIADMIGFIADMPIKSDEVTIPFEIRPSTMDILVSFLNRRATHPERAEECDALAATRNPSELSDIDHEFIYNMMPLDQFCEGNEIYTSQYKFLLWTRIANASDQLRMEPLIGVVTKAIAYTCLHTDINDLTTRMVIPPVPEGCPADYCAIP